MYSITLSFLIVTSFRRNKYSSLLLYNLSGQVIVLFLYPVPFLPYLSIDLVNFLLPIVLQQKMIDPNLLSSKKSRLK